MGSLDQTLTLEEWRALDDLELEKLLREEYEGVPRREEPAVDE